MISDRGEYVSRILSATSSIDRSELIGVDDEDTRMKLMADRFVLWTFVVVVTRTTTTKVIRYYIKASSRP